MEQENEEIPQKLWKKIVYVFFCLAIIAGLVICYKAGAWQLCKESKGVYLSDGRCILNSTITLCEVPNNPGNYIKIPEDKIYTNFSIRSE